jgi:hypothetical protein
MMSCILFQWPSSTFFDDTLDLVLAAEVMVEKTSMYIRVSAFTIRAGLFIFGGFSTEKSFV